MKRYLIVFSLVNLLALAGVVGFVFWKSSGNDSSQVGTTTSPSVAESSQNVESVAPPEQGVISISRSLDKSVRTVSVFCSLAGYEADSCEIFKIATDESSRTSLGVQDFKPSNATEKDLAWEINLDESKGAVFEAVLSLDGKQVRAESFTLE